jgi:hypothetical protein
MQNRGPFGPTVTPGVPNLAPLPELPAGVNVPFAPGAPGGPMAPTPPAPMGGAGGASLIDTLTGGGAPSATGGANLGDPRLMGLAEGLLSASGWSARPISFSEALAMGLKSMRAAGKEAAQAKLAKRKLDIDERLAVASEKKAEAELEKALRTGQLLPGSKEYVTATGQISNRFIKSKAYGRYKVAREQMEAVRGAASGATLVDDTDLVFAIAKMWDPTSVVREGEQATIRATGGKLPSLLMGAISAVNGKSALRPETKAAIIASAKRRFATYEKTYGELVRNQLGIAGRNKVNALDVGLTQEDIDQFGSKKQKAANTPTAVITAETQGTPHSLERNGLKLWSTGKQSKTGLPVFLGADGKEYVFKK